MRSPIVLRNAATTPANDATPVNERRHEWAKSRLDRDEAVGAVDIDKLNVHGGSVALGHPFGATGARMVTTMASEMARTGKNTALLGICAAGGIGASAVLERVG